MAPAHKPAQFTNQIHAGCSFLDLYAHSRGTVTFNSSHWYERLIHRRFLRSPPKVSFFSVYPSIISPDVTRICLALYVSFNYPVVRKMADCLTLALSAVFSDCFGRLHGRPDVGSGWQAVATDVDEQVEMVEGPR